MSYICRVVIIYDNYGDDLTEMRLVYNVNQQK